MKKYLFFYFIFFIPLITMGQSSSSKKDLMNKLDEFINEFGSTSSFREIGGSEFSETQATKFKSMFAENAIIFDDINASIVEDLLGGSPYQLKSKPIEEYIADVRKSFPAGIRVDILNSAIDFSKLDSGKINIVINKKVTGKSSSLNRFENNDTLFLELLVSPENRFLIKKISMIGSSFICANDKDNDGVIDEQDACPGVKGEMRFKGCPDRDRDGIADNLDECPDEYGTYFNKGCPPGVFTNKFSVDVFLGMNMNSPKNVAIEKSSLAFNDLDVERSNEGKTQFNSNSTSSLIAGLEVALSLNTTKTIALGLGLNYNKFTNDLSWNGFHAEFKELDNEDGSTHSPFRRLLTLHQTKESLETQVISFPLLLKFRKRLEEKFGIYYEIGPAFDLISIQSNSSAVADKEAIYIYNSDNKEWTYTKNYSPTVSDWLITRDAVNANSSGNAATYFNQLQASGYDVALDKAMNSSTEKISRIGFSGIARVGAFYMVDRSMSVFAGAVYAYHISSKKVEGTYQPVTGSDQYHSLINGTKKYNVQNYGIMLGVRYGFGK